MTLVNACCTLKPVVSNYEPVGKTTVLENPADASAAPLEIYHTGDPSAKKAIIVFYDIFGFHNNTKQTADRLGEAGFRVVMPDIFRGNPWTEMPIVYPKLLAWLNDVASDEIVMRDIKNVVQSLKDDGVATVGAVGFCWGAKPAIQGSEAGLLDAIGSAHPSFVTPELAETIACPTIFLPSKDEADFIPVMEVLKKKSFGDKCQHVRFDDMNHGWCGARSDFSNEHNAKRTADAISLLAEFFAEHL